MLRSKSRDSVKTLELLDSLTKFMCSLNHRGFQFPLTPAGLLAARQLSEDGIPINFTLGFSARQNYVITAIARPAFVNVFLGRLNAFVADHELGSGEFVGEKATISSQQAVLGLRAELVLPR